MNQGHEHHHDFMSEDKTLAQNERRTALVVGLTAVMMVAEVSAGYLTGSMALLADGWHMASHAGALFISVMAYRLARSADMHRQFTFGAGKLIPLGGYTSALILGMIALLMMIESIQRLWHPTTIEFKDALIVAVIGLVVNLISAKILGGKHTHSHGDHDHSHGHDDDHDGDHVHHDHNLRSAYLHVLADALTSVTAIGALLCGLYFGWTWIDPAMGIVGGVVILVWGVRLCRQTAWELLDGHARPVDTDLILSLVRGENAEVADLHCWRVAPNAYACELVVESAVARGPDFYRNLLRKRVPLHHVIVEEHVKSE